MFPTRSIQHNWQSCFPVEIQHEPLLLDLVPRCVLISLLVEEYMTHFMYYGYMTCYLCLVYRLPNGLLFNHLVLLFLLR